MRKRPVRRASRGAEDWLSAEGRKPSTAAARLKLRCRTSSTRIRSSSVLPSGTVDDPASRPGRTLCRLPGPPAWAAGFEAVPHRRAPGDRTPSGTRTASLRSPTPRITVPYPTGRGAEVGRRQRQRNRTRSPAVRRLQQVTAKLLLRHKTLRKIRVAMSARPRKSKEAT